MKVYQQQRDRQLTSPNTGDSCGQAVLQPQQDELDGKASERTKLNRCVLKRIKRQLVLEDTRWQTLIDKYKVKVRESVPAKEPRKKKSPHEKEIRALKAKQLAKAAQEDR